MLPSLLRSSGLNSSFIYSPPHLPPWHPSGNVSRELSLHVTSTGSVSSHEAAIPPPPVHPLATVSPQGVCSPSSGCSSSLRLCSNPLSPKWSDCTPPFLWPPLQFLMHVANVDTSTLHVRPALHPEVLGKIKSNHGPVRLTVWEHVS